MKRLILSTLVLLSLATQIFGQQDTELNFTAVNGPAQISLNIYGSPAMADFQYKMSGDSSWTDYTIGQMVSLSIGEKVYFREVNIGDSLSTGKFDYYYFDMSGTISADGNIMSLLDSTMQKREVPAFAFAKLFSNCSTLVKTPDIPATKLNHGCYFYMFEGCSSLVNVSALPATTMADSCYSDMFFGCTSLTTAPALPADTLADMCYHEMFTYCNSLINAPALPATTMAKWCYCNMFSYCTSLTDAPILPATTLARYCYRGMFEGCDSLTTAPSLPATTLDEGCYAFMFSDCSTLTTVPNLSATTLAPGCCSLMFNNCPMLENAPALPATTLANGCYANMFSGCSSLTSAPSLPADTLAEWCYSGMFAGCSSLTTVPSLPADTLAEGCYQNMFYGCSSMIVNINAPGAQWIIPAPTSAPYALNNMFTGTGGTMNGTPTVNTTYYIYSGGHTVTANVNDSTMGTVSGAGYYADGDTAILTATPNAGYVFSGWDNGATANTIYIVVESDSVLTAIFHSIPLSVDDVEGKEYVVYSNDKDIHINGAVGELVRVYDVSGKLISEIYDASDEESVMVYVAGVYFVRIDDKKPIRVIVK